MQTINMMTSRTLSIVFFSTLIFNFRRPHILSNQEIFIPPYGKTSRNIEDMRTLKHQIITPKLYELIIKGELKQDTSLYVNNFYSRVKISLNAVTNIKNYFLSLHNISLRPCLICHMTVIENIFISGSRISVRIGSLHLH